MYLHLDNFIILLILKLTCSSFIHWNITQVLSNVIVLIVDLLYMLWTFIYTYIGYTSKCISIPFCKLILYSRNQINVVHEFFTSFCFHHCAFNFITVSVSSPTTHSLPVNVSSSWYISLESRIRQFNCIFYRAHIKCIILTREYSVVRLEVSNETHSIWSKSHRTRIIKPLGRRELPRFKNPILIVWSWNSQSNNFYARTWCAITSCNTIENDSDGRACFNLPMGLETCYEEAPHNKPIAHAQKRL